MKVIDQTQPHWWKHSSSAWHDVVVFFSESKLVSTSSKTSINLKDAKNWQIILIGRSNNSYCFTDCNVKYFVKITNQFNEQFLPYERTVILKDVVSEELFTQLSTWLVDTYFQSKEVIIQSWFESVSLDLALNQDIKIIKLLARFLANLHSIKLAQLPKFDLVNHLHKYQAIALNQEKNKNLTNEINACFELSLKSLKYYKSISLCHYDLNLNNILVNKNSLNIKVIDWEYICIGDPVFDLTAIINNFKFPVKQESYFISCYRNYISSELLNDLDLSKKNINNIKQLNSCIYELWEFGQ